MSYNGPPPPYSEATSKSTPGHVMQTPLGPIQPHMDQMKPAPGEFMGSMANPYRSPKQDMKPTNAPYPSNPSYSPPSQYESGPYPRGTINAYPASSVGGGASYQTPPSVIGGGAGPQRYQNAPRYQMPPSGPVGSGVNPGIYPNVGYNQAPPYPTDTFERRASGPQSFPLPHATSSPYNPDSNAALSGRMGQMNISGPTGNYPRPNSPYPSVPSPVIGSGTSPGGYSLYTNAPNPVIGGGTSPGRYSPYQGSPSPVIGSGTSPRGFSPYPSAPVIGSGATPGRYSPYQGSPMIGSGTTSGRYSPQNPGYSSSPRPYPTPYNTPMMSNFPPPVVGVAPIGMGTSSSPCPSAPMSSSYCSPYPSCHKPHRSHHFHHC